MSSYAPPSAPGLSTPRPIGIQRNMWKLFFLSLITLGLYGVYWAYYSHEDIKQHTGEGVGGVVGAVVYFIAGVVTLFLLPIEIKKMYERDGQESPVSAATAAWILLLGIPWYVKCQGALNREWASKGALPA
jgi:hypothetical protein